MDVYFFKIGLPNRSLDCSKNVITGSYFKKIWFHGEIIRFRITLLSYYYQPR